jgi:membrane protein
MSPNQDPGRQERRPPPNGSIGPGGPTESPGDLTGSPESPTALPHGSWTAVLRRTVREFQDDELTDRAAALTYYGVLSIFPALLVLVSLVGLAGQDATQALIGSIGEATPGSVQEILTDAITNLQRSQNAAGLIAIVSLATALWSASGYIAGFMRASNTIYDVPEGRPVWKTLPIRVGVTALMMVLIAVSAIGVVVSGGVARWVGDLFGLSDTAVTIWNVAKWFVLLFIVATMFAILYWASPNVRQGFRWVTPGGLFAIGLWAIASAAFAFYVANFASYNKIYGSLAGVIIFLVWLWISNIAILLGAELNAELERSRAMAAGHPESVEPYVELRQPPKDAGHDTGPPGHDTGPPGHDGPDPAGSGDRPDHRTPAGSPSARTAGRSVFSRRCRPT